MSLEFDQNDWWEQLERNHKTGQDENILADLTVDGITYPDVGVRFKGLTSYMTGISRKKSFNIAVNETYPDQRLMGYKTLNLNNCNMYYLTGIIFKLLFKILNCKGVILIHEEHRRLKERNLFSLRENIILYDLSNTYFEGEAKNNKKAKRGRSKEKRTDCPPGTLGIVIDEMGFPKKSKIFKGNISEPDTLKIMIEDLQGSKQKESSKKTKRVLWW